MSRMIITVDDDDEQGETHYKLAREDENMIDRLLERLSIKDGEVISLFPN